MSLINHETPRAGAADVRPSETVGVPVEPRDVRVALKRTIPPYHRSWAKSLLGIGILVLLGPVLDMHLTGLGAEEFDMQVDPLYETSEDLVVRLRFQTTQRRHYLIWSAGIPQAWHAMPLPAGRTWWGEDDRLGELYLFSSTTFAGKEQRLKTILGQHRDQRVTTSDLDYRRLSITMPPGRYPLNTRLLMGRYDGHEVHLAVGDAEKLQQLRTRMSRRRHPEGADR